MSETNPFERVVDATVKFPKRGGQGVLVPGSMVLTVSHVLSFDRQAANTGPPLEGESETLKNRKGSIFCGEVLFAEWVSDAAVVGAHTEHFPAELEAFEDFVNSTQPVPFRPDFPTTKDFPVHLLNQDGEWIPGRVVQHGPPGHPRFGTMWVKYERPTHGGDSGSPVVDENGKLVGLHSSNLLGGIPELLSLPSPCALARGPVPLLTLPRWILDQILTE